MSDPPPVPQGPAEDLVRARQSVLAVLAGTGGSEQLPTLQAVAPLRALPPVIEAKLANRAEAGLSLPGGDHPGGGRPRGAGLPRITSAAARFLARDPLRLTSSDRREIAKASRWQSRQPWTGPLAFCTERALVVAATYAAERIARSPAWRSGRLDEHRVRLDLAGELDQIDAQAFRIASARYQGSVGGLPVAAPASPVVDQAWETTVTRVAALSCYADSLDGLARRQAEALARMGDPVRDSELMAGSVLDEIASDDLAVLSYFFAAALFSGPGDDFGL